MTHSKAHQQAIRQCRAALAEREFVRTSCGGYRLGPLPVEVRLDRERFPDGATPHCDWSVLVGTPDARPGRHGLEPSAVMLSQHEQARPSIAMYRVESEADAERFVEEFKNHTLRIVDRYQTAEDLADGLLSGRVKAFGSSAEPHPNYVTAGAVYLLASAYNLERHIAVALDLLRSERADPEKADKINFMASMWDIPLL